MDLRAVLCVSAHGHMDRGGVENGMEKEKKEKKLAAYITSADTDICDPNYYIIWVLDRWERHIFETGISRPIQQT